MLPWAANGRNGWKADTGTASLNAMLAILALMVGAPWASPSEPLVGDLYSAIWQDVTASAMIGNGDGLAAEWYNAGSKEPEARDLHIRDLKCKGNVTRYRCRFSLLRDDQLPENSSVEAARLSCSAIFEPEVRQGGWAIKHYPPSEQHVHSQSTMRCNRLPTD